MNDRKRDHNATEMVNRFWASYTPRQDEPSAAEFKQIAEEERQLAALGPLEPACLEWWSSLPTSLQNKWLADPKTPTIGAAWRERCRRQQAAESARASVALEGFSVPEGDIANMQKFINGEISFSEALETLYLKASA